MSGVHVRKSLKSKTFVVDRLSCNRSGWTLSQHSHVNNSTLHDHQALQCDSDVYVQGHERTPRRTHARTTGARTSNIRRWIVQWRNRMTSTWRHTVPTCDVTMTSSVTLRCIVVTFCVTSRQLTVFELSKLSWGLRQQGPKDRSLKPEGLRLGMVLSLPPTIVWWAVNRSSTVCVTPDPQSPNTSIITINHAGWQAGGSSSTP